MTASTAALTGLAVPSMATAGSSTMPRSVRSLRFSELYPGDYTDDELREITQRALDAARQAGAVYADVRITRTAQEQYSQWSIREFPWPAIRYVSAIGVRALVNGYWGYASHPTPSLEHAAHLGTAATNAAKVGAMGERRPVELAMTPVVRNGVWQTPVEIDPFTIPYGEKIDGIRMITDYVYRQRPGLDPRFNLELHRDLRIFASTDGSYCTQTIFNVAGKLELMLEPHWQSGRSSLRLAPFHTPRAGGWEQVIGMPLRARLPRLLDEADRMRIVKPPDIGRYDVVFDSQAAAAIVDATLAPATDLFRAMGYDANGAGTTFFSDPEAMVGSFSFDAPLLTLTANRSMPHGAASVKWDDEGVEPDTFRLIDRGVLVDFQTTRESATWLAPYYQRMNRPVRSHGCTGTDSAVDITGAAIPNLELAPGDADISFEDMVAQTERGYAVLGGVADSDHQCLNGWGMGNAMFEIRNGKIGTAITGASYLFRTPELMKNIIAVGGASSAESYGVSGGKSWSQRWFRTVRTGPIKASNISVVNMQRRML